jgi:hypothetical protein
MKFKTAATFITGVWATGFGLACLPGLGNFERLLTFYSFDVDSFKVS